MFPWLWRKTSGQPLSWMLPKFVTTQPSILFYPESLPITFTALQEQTIQGPKLIESLEIRLQSRYSEFCRNIHRFSFFLFFSFLCGPSCLRGITALINKLRKATSFWPSVSLYCKWNIFGGKQGSMAEPRNPWPRPIKRPKTKRKEKRKSRNISVEIYSFVHWVTCIEIIFGLSNSLRSARRSKASHQARSILVGRTIMSEKEQNHLWSSHRPVELEQLIFGLIP